MKYLLSLLVLWTAGALAEATQPTVAYPTIQAPVLVLDPTFAPFTASIPGSNVLYVNGSSMLNGTLSVSSTITATQGIVIAPGSTLNLSAGTNDKIDLYNAVGNVIGIGIVGGTGQEFYTTSGTDGFSFNYGGYESSASTDREMFLNSSGLTVSVPASFGSGLSGNGSGLTSLNGANLTAGTTPLAALNFTPVTSISAPATLETASPPSGTGVVTETLATQAPHSVLIGPASGSTNAPPTERSLGIADLPTNVVRTDIANTMTGVQTISAGPGGASAIGKFVITGNSDGNQYSTFELHGIGISPFWYSTYNIGGDWLFNAYTGSAYPTILDMSMSGNVKAPMGTLTGMDVIASTSGNALSKAPQILSSGSFTLSAGTTTVADAHVTAATHIDCNETGTSGTNAGILGVTKITPGTGFVVSSTNSSDANPGVYRITQ